MRKFSRAAHGITSFTGSGRAVIVIAAAIVAWLAWGVLGDFSRGWELAATAGAPILTLLMLVVLQHSENRESAATRLKLNELLLALEEPDPDVVTAEEKSDEEVHRLSVAYRDEARQR
jgi:low affinity Fe/Cu permease